MRLGKERSIALTHSHDTFKLLLRSHKICVCNTEVARFRCLTGIEFRHNNIPDQGRPWRTGVELARQQRWRLHQVHQARPREGRPAPREPYRQHNSADHAYQG